MKAWMWAVLAIGAAGALFLVSPKAPTVTVDMGDLTLTARAPAKLVMLGATRVDVSPASVPVSGTTVPSSGTKWKLPAWLGSPLAQGALYSVAAIGAVYLLQTLKRRYGLQGKQMLKVTLIVVAVIGAILAFLFKNAGVGLLSNVWVLLGGGGSVLYTIANLVYQWKFRA